MPEFTPNVLPMNTLVYFEGSIPARLTDYELEIDPTSGEHYVRYEIDCPERGGREWVIRADFTLAQSIL